MFLNASRNSFSSATPGELGTKADRVEGHLSDILQLATMWNAILLIDKAGVLMGELGSHDLERNELVSIFLHHLEYFKGVVILTTNRAESIDLAFDSRIDIRLHYSPLGTTARRKVWVKLAARLPSGLSIDEADLHGFAELELNGRQIKSTIKMAHLLAIGNGEDDRV